MTAAAAAFREPVGALFDVRGIPKGQPRPRATIRGKHAGVYDPGTASTWKHAIILEARPLRPRVPIAVPVRVAVEFRMPRPKRLPVGVVWCKARPDVDNLAKALLDALADDGWFADDALVVELSVRKVYHRKDGVPGASVEIAEASQPDNQQRGEA